MRVGIISLLQESNTFTPAMTGREHFTADVLAIGDEVRQRFHDAPHEIGGFFQGVAEEKVDAVPIFAARALPYGVIRAADFNELIAEMLAQLKVAGPLDGLLVAPHGATVAEHRFDADGYWLSCVRAAIGPSIPIIGTIDPHANVSEQMVNACDALIAYRTNPHVDQRERGIEAAKLLVRSLRGEVRPTMAAAFPPMALSIDRQATEEIPCRRLCQLFGGLRERPDVLSASLVLGFPYADVAEMGAATIVVTDDDESLARQLVDQSAIALWDQRQDFKANSLNVEAGVEQGLKSEPPVCLLDMGDNVGGGSPADGTWLFHELLKRKVACSLVVICDPGAVEKATSVGVGNTVRLRIGGYSGPLSGPPIDDEFTVVRFSSGRSTESHPTHGGFTSFDHGRTAIVQCSRGLTIVATQWRMVPFSLNQLRACGIDPVTFRIIVAKGVNAPIAAYREVCRSFIRVDTPGVTAADMTKLPYKRRRRPMFPFEPDCRWPITFELSPS